MKTTLLKWLACPLCRRDLVLEVFVREGAEVREGVLSCKCGRVYPIVKGIPRLLLDSAQEYGSFLARHGRYVPSYDPIKYSSHQDPTRDSFGYQWSKFPDMVREFREDFLKYIHPIQPSFFRGKLVLDAGCGFGRHLFYAASFGATAIGMDLSHAVDHAWENTQDLPNANVVQGDIYSPPFKNGIFDYIYCLGVLHHLPYPEEGFNSLIPLIRPGGTTSIWVYSTSRKAINVLLETVRIFTTRLPYRLRYILSFAGACVDWCLSVLLYWANGVLGKFAASTRLLPDRIGLYMRYPFVVWWADWFDRLSAPIRFYYDRKDLRGWARMAGLENVVISPTGLYGWRLKGRKEERTKSRG